MKIITYNYNIPKVPAVIIGQKKSRDLDVEISLGTDYFGNKIYGVLPLNLKKELELKTIGFENFDRHGIIEKRSIVKPTIIIRNHYKPVKIDGLCMFVYNGNDVIFSRMFLIKFLHVKRIIMDFQSNKVSYVCFDY